MDSISLQIELQDVQATPATVGVDKASPAASCSAEVSGSKVPDDTMLKLALQRRMVLEKFPGLSVNF